MKQENISPIVMFGDPPVGNLVFHFICGLYLHTEIHKSVLHSWET
jgi:hypothetical protein